MKTSGDTLAVREEPRFAGVEALDPVSGRDCQRDRGLCAGEPEDGNRLASAISRVEHEEAL